MMPSKFSFFRFRFYLYRIHSLNLLYEKEDATDSSFRVPSIMAYSLKGKTGLPLPITEWKVSTGLLLAPPTSVICLPLNLPLWLRGWRTMIGEAKDKMAVSVIEGVENHNWKSHWNHKAWGKNYSTKVKNIINRREWKILAY